MFNRQQLSSSACQHLRDMSVVRCLLVFVGIVMTDRFQGKHYQLLNTLAEGVELRAIQAPRGTSLVICHMTRACALGHMIELSTLFLAQGARASGGQHGGSKNALSHTRRT